MQFPKHTLRNEGTDEGAAAPQPTPAAAPASNNAELDALKVENERMKAKLDELLAETKKAKEAKRQAEEVAEKERLEKAKGENDFKQLYESAMSENEKLKSEIEGMKKQSVESRLNSEAAKLASGLTKDTAKAEILAEKIRARLSFDGEGFKVLDESGALTVSPVESLVASVKDRYAFLVDASGSTGGGASGASNGGAVKVGNKKFNEYTGAELSEIRRSDPQRYAQLKSEFYGA